MSERKVKFLINCVIYLFLFLNGTLRADVIKMINGDIHLGTANITNPVKIEIETLGRKIYVNQKDIQIIMPEISSIESVDVEVVLKDDSVLRGNIRNYDNEIGVFLKTSFGEITIPSSGVKNIYSTSQRKRYYGDLLMISAGGGYYFPFADLQTNFDSNFFAGLTLETNLRKARGLSLGARVLYFPMEYTPSENVTYNSYSLTGRISYRYGDLRFSSVPVLNRIVPFTAMELGGMYISVQDKRENAVFEWRNELIPGGFLFLGFDFSLWGGFSLRVEAGAFAAYQKGFYPAFVSSGGITYSF